MGMTFKGDDLHGIGALFQATEIPMGKKEVRRQQRYHVRLYSTEAVATATCKSPQAFLSLVTIWTTASTDLRYLQT